MALASVTDALSQYNANLGWHLSPSAAELALEAIRYLLVNRAQMMEDQGQRINFESLKEEKAAIEKFLGATAVRAFGRSRVNRARFSRHDGIG